MTLWLLGLPLPADQQTDAVFSTLVNPTDVLAAAFERAFGIRSVGICVEVPGLVGFLSYYLRALEESIELEHLGVNHCGWVSRWTVDGQDGRELFHERMLARLWKDDWYPHSTWMTELCEATGCMRSSAYHNWPFRVEWTARHDAASDKWHATCLHGYANKRDYRRAMLDEALSSGEMVPEPDPINVHPEAAAYTYPNTRHTLGALAVGLAGGQAGPVPLQVRNGESNPAVDSEAWVEVPTVVREGHFEPQSVQPLPEGLFSQTAVIARQRSLPANWLSGKDDDALGRALVMMPEAGPLDGLIRQAEALRGVLK